MKTRHLVFETLLISTTIVVILDAVLGEGSFFVGAWWAILGILQVAHALIITLCYWKDKAIQRWITWYLVAVLANFLLLGTDVVMVYSIFPFLFTFKVLDAIYLITLAIFPAMLALFLWFITWRFRRRPARPGEDNRNAVFI